MNSTKRKAIEYAIMQCDKHGNPTSKGWFLHYFKEGLELTDFIDKFSIEDLKKLKIKNDGG